MTMGNMKTEADVKPAFARAPLSIERRQRD